LNDSLDLAAAALDRLCLAVKYASHEKVKVRECSVSLNIASVAFNTLKEDWLRQPTFAASGRCNAYGESILSRPFGRIPKH